MRDEMRVDLPPPAPRRPLHTRQVTCTGFLRDDGLWDIEGVLLDTKSYTYDDRERGMLAPGRPMHHMAARLTVDNDLVVREAVADMPGLPFEYCAGSTLGFSALPGATLGAGWRGAVDKAIGGTRGCTHMRELLYAMATAAFQTISAYREQHMPELGPPRGKDGAPFFMDKCHSWSRDSPVVARYFPQLRRTRDDT